MKRRTVAGIANHRRLGRRPRRSRATRVFPAAPRATRRGGNPRRSGNVVLRGDAGRPSGRFRVVDDRHGEHVRHRERLLRRRAALGTTMRRATSRTNVTLSRALRLTRFELSYETDSARTDMTGRVDGDSVLRGCTRRRRRNPIRRASHSPSRSCCRRSCRSSSAWRRSLESASATCCRCSIPRRWRRAASGTRYRAESLFVLSDSAVLDTTVTPALWHGARPDTVRAWQVTPDSGVDIGFSGWIDEQGRIVATTQLGLELRRQPYEVAFRELAERPDSACVRREPRHRNDGACRGQDAEGRPSYRFARRSPRQRRSEAQAAPARRRVSARLTIPCSLRRPATTCCVSTATLGSAVARSDLAPQAAAITRGSLEPAGRDEASQRLGARLDPPPRVVRDADARSMSC